MRRGLALWGSIIAAAFMSACGAHTGAASQAVKPSHIVKADPMARAEITPVTQSSFGEDDAIALWEQSLAAFDAGDYSAAYEGFTVINSQRGHWGALDMPDDGQPLIMMMGDAALALGHTRAAQKHYDNSPPSVQRFAGQTLAKIGAGEVDDVEVALNAALEINLQDIRLWQALGRYHDDAERWVEAQEIYVRALRVGADHAAVLNNMGTSLMMQGRYGEARSKFEQASSLRPEVKTYAHNFHLTLALQQDYALMAKALPDSDAAVIYNDAGYLAMRSGDKALARTLLRKALALSPVHFAVAEANLRALSGAL